MKKFSLIICTRNRGDCLNQCLQSIIEQRLISTQWQCETLVIDNASTDDTHYIATKYPVQHHHEPTIGLSHARNRGAKEAKGEWLCYIDDDARLHSGYIERAFWVIENFDFDCFGGMYYAWYPFGKPKWMDNDFGTKLSLRETVRPIDVPELSGGNFLIKKEVLEKAGGFPVDYGMAGEKIGYGEENHLQMRLIERGYKLGFDPALKIDHAVLSHKLELGWHLKSWYAHGRDGQRFSEKHTLYEIGSLILRSVAGGVIKFPFCTAKWLFKKDYFWQNLVWDVVSPVLFRLGQLKGKFS